MKIRTKIIKTITTTFISEYKNLLNTVLYLQLQPPIAAAQISFYRLKIENL